MEELLTQPVLCPTIVGRRQRLEALDIALREACQSSGRVALLSGEAGIGKSRLAHAARAMAEQREMIVLQGACFEITQPVSYAPLLDLLGGPLDPSTPASLAREIEANTRALIPFLPELAYSLPGSFAGAEASETTPTLTALDPASARHRLFRALARYFTILAERRPLLLIVEDLHWGDEGSLEFLLSLARQVATRPILLLLTHRSDEMAPALQRLLAEFDRERCAIELPLAPLTLDETDEMLRAIFRLRRPPRAEFLRRLYDVTEGNPFFIEETLKALASSGAVFYADTLSAGVGLGELPVPRTVQETVQRRARLLGADAYHALTVAAVAGQRFDIAVLKDVLRCDEADVLRWIKELLGAQLVAEESADHVVFRHALTRQAIVAMAPARERRALHQQIAQALERRYIHAPGAHAAELAHHFYHAELWPQANAYAVQAGEQALALYAPGAAREHFTQALKAAQRSAFEVPSTLYRARGHAAETLGDFDGARADYETALQTAQAANDQQAEWQALLDLGAVWTERDYRQTRAYLQRALDHARRRGESADLAASLNRMGNWHMNVEQPDEAQQYHQQALVLYEQLDDRAGIAATLSFLGMVGCIGSDLARAKDYHERAIALFAAQNNRQGLVYSLAALSLCSPVVSGETVIPVVPFSYAEHQVAMALQVAREIGWRAGEVFASVNLLACHAGQGDYQRALEIAHVSVAMADEIAHREWMAATRYETALLYAGLLNMPTAQRNLEEVLSLARDINSPYWLHTAIGGLASVCVAQRDLGRAEALLDQARDPAEPPPTMTMSQRLCWLARVELALARKEPERALVIIDHLYASAGATSETGVGAIPRLAMLRADALTQQARLPEAEDALRAAYATALARGARPLAWRIGVKLGRCLRAQKKQRDAAQVWAEARVLIEDLAATLDEGPTRQAFHQAALTTLPSLPAPTQRRVTQGAYDGLTAREREVARWVARGHTNRQIADELVIAEDTVAAHVKHILSKLDFASRAQIAAWAVNKHLLSTTE